jgi:hypothetical protein
MRTTASTRLVMLLALGFGLGSVPLGACKEANKALETDITGQVTDNRGQPVAGALVRLYTLLDNTHFVEGGDVRSGRAYIDRAAVLASVNSVSAGETGPDGRFHLGAIPNAFLAVVTKAGCSAGFAGFDEQTGVLNADTLITPSIGDALKFEIPGFVIACATPPAVGPEGNSPAAPAFEPPPANVTCDPSQCGAAGGTCEGSTCALKCDAAKCTAAGGTCTAGRCATPTCDVNGCQTAGGTCSADMQTCLLPACKTDADCAEGQPGAICNYPGDVAKAVCQAPAPAEIVPPKTAAGWSGFRITDDAGKLLADASTGNQVIPTPSIPANGLIQIRGDYGGAATTAFVQVQTGAQTCPNLPPRTDFLSVEIAGGKLATQQGDFLELALHGGYEKIQLSSSNVLGTGDRSFAVEIGDRCTAPKHAFVAMLSWDAGPSQPADLDLNVWNARGDLVFVGTKQAAWGRLAKEGKGPGPEVFESDDAAQGPFTIKVQFFSGRPRPVPGKVRIIRRVAGQLVDDTYGFTVAHPKDVAEIGVFTSQ